MSRHLNEEELIDLAEGTRAESLAPHLQSCEVCRRQLADLRVMMKETAGVDVPEPSPLFWDHLSARVRESIADEQHGPKQSWAGQWWQILVPIGALAAVALAVFVTLRGGAAGPAGAPRDVAPAVAGAGSVDTLVPGDDPSFSLIADMAGDLDLDAAAEAGFTATSGTVDWAVFDLTPEERTELRRILKEEVSKS